MSENIDKAKTKIENEHNNFKEKVKKMKSSDVYNMAGVIIFTEATIFHLEQLINDDNLCILINKEDATLEGAVQHIIQNVRNKYGQTGDLPVEEFHELIWEYYKIDHAAAKKAMEDRMAKTKKEIEDRKNKLATNSSNNKKEDAQINLIDILNTNVKLENKKDIDNKIEKSETEELEKNKVNKEKPLSQHTSPNAGPLQVSLFDF